MRVRATPQRYSWSFGDGGTLIARDKGAAYPDLRTTHTYRTPASVQVTLRTGYGGEYSVDGGAWLPIEGEAEVLSPPSALEMLAARSELVAEPLS